MRDFFDECNSKGMAPQEFKAMFCQQCKNPDCVNARWGSSSFADRVATQANRLFHPVQADPTMERYQPIVQAGWKDMLHRAVQLEVSDRRGDWEVPEIPVEDGQVEVSTPTAVDRAIKAMARMGGREEPLLPDPEETLAEEVLQSLQQEEKAPVRPQDKTSTPKPTKGKAKKDFVPPKAANTPNRSGVMVGGGPPPEKPQQPEVKDPWEPPKGPVAQKVRVGGTVVLGGGKPKKEEE